MVVSSEFVVFSLGKASYNESIISLNIKTLLCEFFIINDIGILIQAKKFTIIFNRQFFQKLLHIQ